MIEFINLLQIWKDQGAIQPSGLLEDHDLQALINKMRFEAENLPHEFKTALILLRDLADIQNGAPLVTVEKEWEEIMKKTYDFLEANEG